ncbi:hypothetical protein GQ44DRAFT_336669 [Phaeosphaeriaceae sp. PMI808]|nr:hypothetical protein GQ44DRAFT_336669 [Phaeosphaeriaceae sp. PMI808]
MTYITEKGFHDARAKITVDRLESELGQSIKYVCILSVEEKDASESDTVISLKHIKPFEAFSMLMEDLRYHNDHAPADNLEGLRYTIRDVLDACKDEDRNTAERISQPIRLTLNNQEQETEQNGIEDEFADILRAYFRRMCFMRYTIQQSSITLYHDYSNGKKGYTGRLVRSDTGEEEFYDLPDFPTKEKALDALMAMFLALDKLNHDAEL